MKGKKSIKVLKANLDTIFSRFVRLRDSKNGVCKCCTCGKFGEILAMQNGHYMSRRHLATRFSETNTGVQCLHCNMFDQGKQAEFTKYLERRYGIGTAGKSHIQSSNLTKWGRFEYELLIKEYTQKFNKLVEEKGGHPWKN